MDEKRGGELEMSSCTGVCRWGGGAFARVRGGEGVHARADANVPFRTLCARSRILQGVGGARHTQAIFVLTREGVVQEVPPALLRIVRFHPPSSVQAIPVAALASGKGKALAVTIVLFLHQLFAARLLVVRDVLCAIRNAGGYR